MILGTHNSATGSELVGWLKPLAWVINPTSKCQEKSIAEQLADGVRLFNLQVAFVSGKWRFSHGLAVYREDLFKTLYVMNVFADKKHPIYFQLYLDRCFWCKQDVEAFVDLVEGIKHRYDNEFLVMLDAMVEGTGYHPYNSGRRLNSTEKYWSRAWAKMYGKNWLDRLPLPKYHARKYNREYKDSLRQECHRNAFLMLDFYNYG